MALPSSGSLSIKGAAGAGRSISQEVDGNETGDKSLTTLSVTAGKSAPHSTVEFYGYSSVATPGVPQNVALAQTGVGGDTLQVTYNAPSSGGIVTNYRIEISSDGGGFSLLVDNGTNLSYDHTGFALGHSYIMRVRAENAGGNSAFVESNSVSV